MPLTVRTDIGGSKLVIFKHLEHYIDVKATGRPLAHFTYIECVRQGRVYLRDTVPDHCAPERIVELMRQELLS